MHAIVTGGATGMAAMTMDVPLLGALWPRLALVIALYAPCCLVLIAIIEALQRQHNVIVFVWNIGRRLSSLYGRAPVTVSSAARLP